MAVVVSMIASRYQAIVFLFLKGRSGVSIPPIIGRRIVAKIQYSLMFVLRMW